MMKQLITRSWLSSVTLGILSSNASDGTGRTPLGLKGLIYHTGFMLQNKSHVYQQYYLAAVTALALWAYSVQHWSKVQYSPQSTGCSQPHIERQMMEIT